MVHLGLLLSVHSWHGGSVNCLIHGEIARVLESWEGAVSALGGGCCVLSCFGDQFILVVSLQSWHLVGDFLF